MGKVVMQRILVDRPVSWRSYVDASGGLPLLAWETEMFGLTNTEAAGVLTVAVRPVTSWQHPAP